MVASSRRAPERLEADSYRLRGELEELYNQACAVLRGDRSRSAPRSMAQVRSERETELSDLAERIEWYNRDIKILKRQVEGARAEGKSDFDPQELQNLLTERKAEIARLHEEEDVLGKISEKQTRAERERSHVSEEVADQVRRVKEAVQHEKRRHMQLREERARMDEELKVQRGEVWELEKRLKRNVAVIQQANARQGDPLSLQKLQRHEAGLREAIHQDEKKYKAESKDRDKNVKNLQNREALLKKQIAKMEGKTQKLRLKLHDMASQNPLAPDSPRSGDELSQPSPGPSPRDVGGFASAFDEHEKMMREVADMEMEVEIEMNEELHSLGKMPVPMRTLDLLQDNLPGGGLDDHYDDDAYDDT